MRRILFTFLSLFSIFYLFSFIILCVVRFHNPLTNGAFEDATLHQAQRIVEGELLYSDPTIDYIPLLYGPILFYLSAFFVKIFGMNLPAIRLVPIISNLGIILFSYVLIKSFLNRSNKIALVHSLLFLGIFYSINSFAGYWLDLAKVDATYLLWMCFILVVFLRYLKKNSIFDLFILSLLSVLMIYTKQIAILSTAFLIFYVLLCKGLRSSILFFLIFSTIFSLVTGIFYWRDGNNFFIYNFILPGTHPYVLKSALEKISFILPSIILTFASVLIILKNYKIPIQRTSAYFNNRYRFLVFSSLVYFIFSYLGRSKAGAVENSWLYFYLNSSLLFSVSIFVIRRSKIQSKRSIVLNSILVLFLVQMVILAYNPIKSIQIQKEKMVKNKLFLNSFCKLEHPVLYPDVSFYSTMLCNQKSSFSLSAAIDLVYYHKLFDVFSDSYESKIKSREYNTIFMFSSYSIENLKQMIASIDLMVSKNKSGTPNLYQKNMKKALELHLLIHEYYDLVSPESYSEDEKNIIESSEKFSMYKLKQKE